ncbi:MAG: hypothetical protein OIN83_06615, partial [Candidatus Methanoperedens sp.]|nr:hypothetical protein [Candidatus Methanoperedens sp.]
ECAPLSSLYFILSYISKKLYLLIPCRAKVLLQRVRCIPSLAEGDLAHLLNPTKLKNSLLFIEMGSKGKKAPDFSRREGLNVLLINKNKSKE